MALEGEDQLHEALRELHNNIQRKRFAIDALESEYNKICMRRENNVKHLEELHSKKYFLESYLKSSECRIEEYEKNEKDWEAETSNLNEKIAEVTSELQHQEYLSQLDDETFDRRIIQLTEKRARSRDTYERSNNREEIETLRESRYISLQEIADIELMLNETKLFKWVPSEDTQEILDKSSLRGLIRAEIEKMAFNTQRIQLQHKHLRDTVSTLEQELEKLSNQI